MANSIPSGITFEYDNGAGTPVDITQHVQSINDVEVESILEEIRPFGQSWEQNLPVGIAKLAQIELSGLYDDTASTGPDALFAGRAPETPASSTRTFTITWVGSKTTSVETFLAKYKRSPDKNGLTKYTVTLQPTGAVTEV